MGAGKTANRRLWRYIVPYWRMIALGTGISLLTVGFNIAIPFVSRYVIDGLAARELGRGDLLRWLGLYVVATAFATALSYWMRWLPLLQAWQSRAMRIWAARPAWKLPPSA